MKKIYAVHAAYGDEMDKLEAKMTEALYEKGAFLDSEMEDEESRPYKVINGTALYDIKGKMMSTGNWFTKWLGIPSYDVIADSLSQMAEDEEVQRILIHMDTPGGNVSGISDVSDVWRRTNAIKPITVHSPGILASAGVWLASNSDKIYASETADVGSIGVIIQHLSYQEALKKEGIDVTQIKSAPMKHIGSPAKNLTAEDKEYLQKKVDESDSLFKKQLYTTRPQISAEAFSGATFAAAESVRLGLIDGVMTYSAVFELLSASADSDNNHSYREEFSMKRKVTQAMAEAAIASGANADDLDIVSQEEYDALQAEQASAGEEETSEGDQEASGEESNLEASNSPPVDDDDEVNPLTAQVDALTSDLAEVQAQVETLTAENADLQKQMEQRASEPLRVIAEDRIKHMRIALGLQNIDMSEFSTDSIVAEYNALDKNFRKHFIPGGHVKPKAVDGKDTKKVESPKITSIESARLNSVGL